MNFCPMYKILWVFQRYVTLIGFLLAVVFSVSLWFLLESRTLGSFDLRFDKFVRSIYIIKQLINDA